ncbi:hypothetical protein [Pseudoduganella violaceinigra]|uniref:hypothetical protein n=1 Tax=Pseudoduganella violaceinigra TaxID=246602 RepID=UPI000480D5B7|nr:hypothetical protein [Pseudoduganella violaceinigra]
MSTIAVHGLKAFSKLVHGNADRNLQLIRAIDETLGALYEDIERFSLLNLGADRYIEHLRRGELLEEKNGTDLPNLFDEARDALGRLYKLLEEKHLCAVSDHDLTDDDGIVEAYARLLAEVSDLHNKVNTMAWLVREIEADRDTVMPGSFADVEELFEAMGV